MEVHLDLVGGMAGDMFIAALLDAFPHHEHQTLHAIRALDDVHPVSCSLAAHEDHALRGRRFKVEPTCRPASPAGVPFAAFHDTASHAHVTWKSIRSRLERSALEPATGAHAIGIFQLLADAEAFVHGTEPEKVSFHEVGAWDSIADIVGAAALIHAIGATRWTMSAAPLGAGRIRTAHGVLPVPAPAAARLLMGMPTIDDGVGGERVTPTGAAILRYLCPPARAPRAPTRVRTLVGSGTGFGMRRLPGMSNHVRALCFEAHEESGGGQRRIGVLEFEVDDQSGEDLAAGLDRLRAHDAVLDVTQTPVFGKKGRMMVHVRVLARQARLDDVIDACFRETTTIGLRHHAVHGIGLERLSQEVDVDGHRLRVKVVERPGGRTAKAESDDVLAHEDHARRASQRRRAE
ncbi:MAG: LarC family nickel insertion protein, partial [Gammaproteobacteria bacterium]|nr:LarC family nickel insertion protein [Gammaproteobacteria bacterium]